MNKLFVKPLPVYHVRFVRFDIIIPQYTAVWISRPIKNKFFQNILKIPQMSSLEFMSLCIGCVVYLVFKKVISI